MIAKIGDTMNVNRMKLTKAISLAALALLFCSIRAPLACADDAIDEKIAEPVQNLFLAWENLDHNQYMAQWAPGATQYDERGHRRRDLHEISQRRSADFKKYRHVEMNYRILETKVTGENTAEVRVEYFMNLMRQDGKEVHDGSENKPNQEVYLLVYDANNQRWLITENHDYLGRQ